MLGGSLDVPLCCKVGRLPLVTAGIALTAEKPVLEQAVTELNSRKPGGGEAHICVS